MAIAHDSSTDGLFDGAATSFTFAHTTSGSDRYLVVTVIDDVSGGSKVTGVTYGGVAMTQIDTARLATGGRYQTVWGLANPAAGVNNVVITRSNSGYIRGVADSYTGAQQTTTPDASTGGTATTASFALSNTSVADNCWTIMCASNNAGATTAGANTTKRAFAADGGAGLTQCDSNSAKTPAGSVTLTLTRTSCNWAGSIFSLAPAASASNSDMFLMF